MLSDDHKHAIQGAYSQLLDSKGYAARFCQRKMIADIANTLGNIEMGEDGVRTGGNHICVVEAGTGTGKTVAYVLAALPLAQALGKKLVIATATVALQEQIVLKDLPDIAAHSGLEFSYTLAKGRRRYLCLARLDQALQMGEPRNQSLALYDDEMFGDTDASQLALYEAMLTRLGRGDWNGERDSWSEAMDDRAWARVSTDHVQCTGRKCSHFQNCYFYRAREQIHKVDCIVTNQDLVLADLMMGGGAVLPSPEDTIYIFDEGHHLVDKAISHFSNFVQMGSTRTWLDQLPATVSQLVAEMGDIGQFPRGQAALEDEVYGASQCMAEASALLEPFRELGEANGEDRRYRFPLGRVDDEIRSVSARVLAAINALRQRIEPLVTALEGRLAEADGPAESELPEQWLPVIAGVDARLGGSAALWEDFAREDPDGAAPYARWLTFQRDIDLMISASPVDIHAFLGELLWSRCFGAVLTSATLAVSGNFDRLRAQTGIGRGNLFDALPSPFDFRGQATLSVPKMSADPRDPEAHTAEVAERLPALLERDSGGLVLFSSWRQMHQVIELIDSGFRERVLAQGELSKAEIVSQHRARVDAREQSVIFGLASFAEGIDLPGEYCDHVVVVKIPFAVPDDPVGATLSEWIEARGGNAFTEIMIPDAAIRMVQACGRLLRTETDRGRITILDRRLVSQRYGGILLDALPPYARDIE